MRRKIVAGNWKMNLEHQDATKLLGEIANQSTFNSEVIIFPPSLYLSEFSFRSDKNISIGAQNCYYEKQGAFTGEISASMIASVGAKWCLTGHSERRSLFGETDLVVEKKIEAILSAGLNVMFCCGEPKEIREAGTHMRYVGKQVKDALSKIEKNKIKNIAVAYEPVWAIGTGLTATPVQAQEMHELIRGIVAELFGKDSASEIRILYGGSCNEQNASELFSQPDVDGGLIGGASLKLSSFLSIIKAAE
jgi:triosephosphate isomerase (TIM)